MASDMAAPAPWWYRALARIAPARCREIPEAANPERIVLRQFALVKRYVYLQAFASSEDPRWLHSHQWRHLLVFVLWGSYTERRMVGLRARRVRAPAVYHMGPDTIHQVLGPRSHTSIAIGLHRDENMRRYYSAGAGVPWREHVREQVARL